MATVKVFLNERKENVNGELPVWLRITKNRKSKYIAIGVKIKKEQWNFETNRVRKSHPNSQRINNYIAQKVSDAEKVALELETNSKGVTPRKVKDTILGRSSESYIRYAERNLKHLEATGKISTLSKQKAVLSKLKVYLNNEDLLFDEITVSFLKDYETYLRDTLLNGINTIHSDLKSMRKLINDAIREEIFTIEKNPFLRYKLKTENTEKNFLTETELVKLEEFPLDQHLKINHHRNMYIFAAYTGGIRISDMLQLKWENYDGERLIIRTKKTNDTLSIKVPDKAKDILAFYFNDKSNLKDFIFPFLKNHIDYSDPKVLFRALSSGTAYANKDLYTLAKKCGFNKKLHFHTSRHTFATRALRKGMRIEYVSKLMAHSSIKTTQIYAKIVNEELDKAMDVFND